MRNRKIAKKKSSVNKLQGNTLAIAFLVCLLFRTHKNSVKKLTGPKRTSGRSYGNLVWNKGSQFFFPPQPTYYDDHLLESLDVQWIFLKKTRLKYISRHVLILLSLFDRVVSLFCLPIYLICLGSPCARMLVTGSLVYLFLGWSVLLGCLIIIPKEICIFLSTPHIQIKVCVDCVQCISKKWSFTISQSYSTFLRVGGSVHILLIQHILLRVWGSVRRWKYDDENIQGQNRD